MTGCCLSLIEQDVSVLFCLVVSVVGRGSCSNSAVDVLSLFSHFYFGFDGMGENCIFCRLVSHCSSDVCFLCFFCFGRYVVLCFVCRCVYPAERRVLSGAGHSFFSVSAILFFLSFCMKIFYICISLFLLFISFFFSFRCFSCPLVLSICLDGSSLSFRFFSFLFYSIFVYSFFFLNFISLYKH